MFRETEGGEVVKTDFLAAATINDDELKMDFQKGSGDKDNSRPLSSANLPFQ